MKFAIKFDFQAEEPQELSVSEGELVNAPDNAEHSSEPWTLVETFLPPFNRGFVPTSYLIPVKSSPAPNKTKQPPAATSAPPPPPSFAPSFLKEWDQDTASQRSFEDSHLHSFSEPKTTTKPPPSSAALVVVKPASTGSRNPAQVAGEYQHLIAQHDRQFQQVMHQRHEQFKALDEDAVDLTRRIDASKQKASEIAVNVTDITSIIEGERRRWKEKMNEQVSLYSQ